MTRKNLANGLILAFSVVLVRFVDVKIYDMNLFITLLLIVGLVVALMKITERLPSLEKPVGKPITMAVNSTLILIIFLSFFILEQ